MRGGAGSSLAIEDRDRRGKDDQRDQAEVEREVGEVVVEHPRDAVEVVRAPEERVVAKCSRTTRDHDRRTHECQPGHGAGDPELAQTTPADSSDGEHECG